MQNPNKALWCVFWLSHRLLTVWHWCLLSWHFSFLMSSFFWHQDKKKECLKGLLLNKCNVGNTVSGVFLTSEFGTPEVSAENLIWLRGKENALDKRAVMRSILLVNYLVIEKNEKRTSLSQHNNDKIIAWISLSGKNNATFMAFSYITIICYLILFFPDADLSVESWTVKVWSFALVEKKRNTNGRMQRPASATCVEKEHDDLYFNALLRKRIATSNPHRSASFPPREKKQELKNSSFKISCCWPDGSMHGWQALRKVGKTKMWTECRLCILNWCWEVSSCDGIDLRTRITSINVTVAKREFFIQWSLDG